MLEEGSDVQYDVAVLKLERKFSDGKVKPIKLVYPNKLKHIADKCPRKKGRLQSYGVGYTDNNRTESTNIRVGDISLLKDKCLKNGTLVS